MATAPPLTRTFGAATASRSDKAQPAAAARPPLDLKRVAWNSLLIVALLLINKPGNVGAGIFFAILTCMVLYSPQAAFKALAICWLGLMINQAFVPKSIVWTPARTALPLLAFIRFSIDMPRMGTTLFTSRTYIAFLVYVATMAMCSMVSGLFVQVALLKLFNFWAVVSAVLGGVTVIRKMRIDMTEWFVSLIAAATFLGVASIALGVDNNFKSFIGQLRSDAFVGAFLHPNCHSVYASLFTVFLATVFLIGDYRHRRMTLLMIAIWVVFMIWSRARASILATVVGLLVLFLLARPLRNRFGWRLRVNVTRSTIAAGLVAVAVIMPFIDMATDGSVHRGFVEFIQKRGDGSNDLSLDTEKVLESRAGLMERSLRNFQEHPLFGIGFQVSTDPRFAQNATLFSAPVEKGVIVTAVLEEGGVFGATAFVVFLLMMITEFSRGGNVPALVILAAFLASNMGEMTFFSPGGSGAFGWAMMGASMILGDHCWQRGPGPIARPPALA